MRISETNWNNLPNQSFANSEADPELRQLSAEDVSEASKAVGYAILFKVALPTLLCD